MKTQPSKTTSTPSETHQLWQELSASESQMIKAGAPDSPYQGRRSNGGYVPT